MITMFGLFINVTLNNDFYQIQPGERSYMAPTLVKTYIVFYRYLAVAYIYLKTWYYTYIRAHKLFGHSRVFILTIMIYVKRIIFSNDCISKRLKDRKLKLFS